LRALFDGAPRVNDPRLGWVEEERFDQFVANSHQGLLERNASVEHVSTTATARGATEECVLRLVRYGNAVSPARGHRQRHRAGRAPGVDPDLPQHVAPHRIPSRARPILPVVAGLLLPDVIGRFHDCLAAATPPGSSSRFAPSGGLREARDPGEVHRGPASLLRFFNVLFANGGGLGLEHCAIADEGASCALEYVVTTWGRSSLPHQAAAAVYERADTGLLAEVRMYDDVESPLHQN
jgi:hypothetical protein